MKSADLEEITKSISEKVGKELAGVIADDLGNLITLNTTALDEKTALQNENAELKERNSQLITSNANLLKQVPYQKDPQAEPIKNEEKKNFSFMAQFDKNGNFII